jgi:hypothetical protein
LDNDPIRMASMYGHIEIVKLLLNDARVARYVDGNDLIRMASASGNVDLVRLLQNDPRVNRSGNVQSGL